MARRERATIVGEVLEQLSKAGGEGAETRLSHVAMRCNLPYDRFTAYLQDLQRRGLVDANDPFTLTAEGRGLLKSFKEWRDGLRLFGMSINE